MHELAILSYHKIGPPPEEWWSWYYVPEDVLADQLRRLRADGWEPIDAAAFLHGLRAPETLAPRSMLLTFDDAYRSFEWTALPVLRELDVPSMLFVPTDFIGGSNAFDEDVEPREDICGWTDIRRLQRAGVSIQSHTASHRAFSELRLDEQERELSGSKRVLEEMLEATVEVVAYPYGDAGTAPGALEAVLERTGYRAGCVYGGGATGLPTADRYRLPRLAMGPDTDVEHELAARMEGR